MASVACVVGAGWRATSDLNARPHVATDAASSGMRRLVALPPVSGAATAPPEDSGDDSDRYHPKLIDEFLPGHCMAQRRQLGRRRRCKGEALCCSYSEIFRHCGCASVGVNGPVRVASRPSPEALFEVPIRQLPGGPRG
ncbi:hypothetical protein HPB47_020198 [Ixodes persulcatus]|uniref:Uncharacterized protein n=1 Tax=Ixodes persulcatus TaxID=34615 RepID=A0AC60QGA8_IXOPE|nr:hypothetical protein HPB47_020198 [Ixodes persulcatus]